MHNNFKNLYEEQVKEEWAKYAIFREQRIVYDSIEYIILPHMGIVTGVCQIQVGSSYVVKTNTNTLFEMGVFELLFHSANLIIQTYDSAVQGNKRYFVLRKNGDLQNNFIVSAKYSADLRIIKTNEITAGIIRSRFIDSFLKNLH